jgi:hypothetical protein
MLNFIQLITVWVCFKLLQPGVKIRILPFCPWVIWGMGDTWVVHGRYMGDECVINAWEFCSRHAKMSGEKKDIKTFTPQVHCWVRSDLRTGNQYILPRGI